MSPSGGDAVAELSCPRCGKPLPRVDVATCACGTWLTPFAASEVLSVEERRVNRTARWGRILRPCPICGEPMLLRGAEPGLFQGCDRHGYWIDADAAENTGLARGIDLEALERKRNDPRVIEALREEQARIEREHVESHARDGEEATRLRAKLEQRDHDLRRAEEELARARRDLDQLGTKVATLTGELAARGDALEVHERQIAKLNAQLDTTERKLLEAQREVDSRGSDLRMLEARAKELFDANNALRSEVAQAREQRKQLDADRAAGAQESSRLQQNLNKVTNTLAEYQRSMQDLDNRYRDLQVERDEFRKVIDAQQERILIVDEARKRVELMFHDLQRRHHHLDVGHELAKGENAKLAQENASMRAELTRLQLEVQRLLRERVVDRSLHDALVAGEELRKELAQAQQTIIGLRTDRETLDRLRVVAEAHARELEQKLDAGASPAPDPGSTST